MVRLELFPLSLTEKLDVDINAVDLLCEKNIFSRNLRPLNSLEIANLIICGGYPEVQNKSEKAKTLWYRSYVEGRLFKDFQQLYDSRGDYYSKLKALMDYLAGLSGNLIKYSNIGNNLGLDDKVIKKYIEILDLMFILKRIPGYLKNRSKRQAITLHKLHFIDTGLVCHLLGIKNPEKLIQTNHFGALLENFVYLELLKQASWSEEQVRIYHFRDAYQHEVDLVLELSNHQIIGIEVKASATIKKEDFKGLLRLQAFNTKDFAYGIVFYSGHQVLPFSQDGVELYALPISFLF